MIGLASAQAARLGIGYVPQGRGLFAGMSVEQNLELALALSDTTVALERGRVTHRGPSRDLRDDLDLRRKVLWLRESSRVTKMANRERNVAIVGVGLIGKS